MTAPVSSADSSSLRIAQALQQRMAAATSDRPDINRMVQAKHANAHERLKQLEAAERAYREEMSTPVYTMELEDGTRFQVMRGGGVSGSGPRGVLVMGLDDLVRDAGFPEAKTQEEAVMQKIIVLQLHYGSEEVRDATRKFLDDAKKAIALLSQMVQMLQDGWKSGTIPLIPVKGTEGNDELKIYSSGRHIMTGAGDDLVHADNYSRVDGEAGNDTIMAGSHSNVNGGDGNDMMSAWSEGLASGGAGDDTIKVWSGGTAYGGAGDDVIKAWSDSVVDGGEGDDVIDAWSETIVDGGTGDDVIKAWSNSVVNGGEGDDMVKAWSEATVDGGAGNDTISVWSDSTARGGDGNDRISGWAGSMIDGGTGNDVIETTLGTAYGGAGDDLIKGSGVLDGGDGDDGIISDGDASIRGGRGDDQILAMGKASIAYGRGDGRDTVAGQSLQYYDGAKIAQGGGTGLATRQASVTFNLGQGLSRRDLQIEVNGNDMKLDFGGGDSITIQDYQNTSATMVFADGSKMQVADFVASGTPLTPAGRAVDLQA